MDNNVKLTPNVTERLPEHEVSAKLAQDFEASEQCEEELRRIRSVLLDRAHWIENLLDAHAARRRGEPRPEGADAVYASVPSYRAEGPMQAVGRRY